MREISATLHSILTGRKNRLKKAIYLDIFGILVIFWNQILYVLGVSTYTDKLEIAAFQSKSKIVFMVLNRTNERISAVIRLRENCAKIVVSPKAIATGIISENVKQKEFHS